MAVLQQTDTAEGASLLGPAQARELTDKIRVMLEGTVHLIVEAYRSRVWLSLGYGSWDDYCRREFGHLNLRPPLEERQQTILSLREAGLSIRAISTATQLGRGTVERGLGSGVPSGTPARIVGSDGKEYSATRPRGEAAAPERLEAVEGRSSSIDDIEDLLDLPPEQFGIGTLTPVNPARRTAEPRRMAARHLVEQPLPQVIQLAGQLLMPGELSADDADDTKVLFDLGLLASRGILSLTSVLGTIDAQVLSSGDDSGAGLASTVQDAIDELGRVLDALHARR